MRLLLDTHIAIWALNGDEKLSGKAIELLQDAKNECYVSAISFAEVAIKHKKFPNRIPYSAEDFRTACKDAGFYELSLSADHALALESLRLKENAIANGDPFDRLILSQAKSEDMLLLTADSVMGYYDEACVYTV